MQALPTGDWMVLKRNTCIAFHLNRINEAKASRALGQVKGSFGPTEACHYYR
jgi:hypothetical protein